MAVAPALDVAQIADEGTHARASTSTSTGTVLSAASLAHDADEVVLAAAARCVSAAGRNLACRAMVAAGAAAQVIRGAHGKEQRVVPCTANHLPAQPPSGLAGHDPREWMLPLFTQLVMRPLIPTYQCEEPVGRNSTKPSLSPCCWYTGLPLHSAASHSYRPSYMSSTAPDMTYASAIPAGSGGIAHRSPV